MWSAHHLTPFQSLPINITIYHVYHHNSVAADQIAPVISGCPGPITNTVPIGTQNTPVTWVEPTAIDNSGIPPTVVRSHQPGDSFPVGSTTVEYTFRDQEGNQAMCTFMVTGKCCLVINSCFCFFCF